MVPIDGREDVAPAEPAIAAAPAGVEYDIDGDDQTAQGLPADPNPPRRSQRLLDRGAPAILADDFAFNISVRTAMRERGAEARPVIMKELEQMVQKGVWHGVRTSGLTDIDVSVFDVSER